MTLQCDTRAQFLWLDEHGIVHSKCKKVDLGLADAQEGVESFTTVFGGIRRPMLADLTNLKSLNRAARTYFAGPETAKVQSAAALLIGSPMGRAIGNFFMGFNKPLIPTRLFTSEESAMEWLLQYAR